VTHVVQFELPDVPEQYVHRIGRTARAGADGSAVAFCAEDERSLLRDIEKITRQKIPSADRRNDPVLAQLSLNANIEAKRGARAEPRGEAQPRRHQRQGRPDRSRNERRGEHRDRDEVFEHQQRDNRSEGGEGRSRSHHRRGKGGSPGWSGVSTKGAPARQANGYKSGGEKHRGQKSANHRKGQNRTQAPARGDVMRVAAGPAGPVTPADALMKHLSSTNPWSDKG
jgi:superfamily II DNA/RNA helicase